MAPRQLSKSESWVWKWTAFLWLFGGVGVFLVRLYEMIVNWLFMSPYELNPLAIPLALFEIFTWPFAVQGALTLLVAGFVFLALPWPWHPTTALIGRYSGAVALLGLIMGWWLLMLAFSGTSDSVTLTYCSFFLWGLLNLGLSARFLTRIRRIENSLE